MATKTLAIKYRPHDWSSVIEQESIQIILQEQLKTNTIKNAYLFTGPAGTGKTTCARIFANEINKGQGSPIEMDAASNSGVDDVRNISQQAKLKSLDSEYKVFIIDEAHAISNTGWQAFLKLIEEPPAKSIFIFATTDPQKIPKTILSRVQRYDFKRISERGIVQRLKLILDNEKIPRFADNSKTDDLDKFAKDNAIKYIAKIAEGGMRDAISLMDKCLSYSAALTLENVVKALGTVDYEVMMDLTDAIITKDKKMIVRVVENIYSNGKDIKQFISQYVKFLLDVQKYSIECSKYMQIPMIGENKDWLESMEEEDFELCLDLLSDIIKLNSSIKWSQSPKYDLEAVLLLFVSDEGEC